MRSDREALSGSERRLVSVRAVLCPLVVALLACAAPAGADLGAEKAAIDREVVSLRSKVKQHGARIGILTEDLTAHADHVHELEVAVGSQRARLGALDGSLSRARARLRTLDRRIAEQTRRLEVAQREHASAVVLLETRVRGIYLADEPDVISFAVGAVTFTDLMDNMELLGRIGRQDRAIVRRVTAARDAIWAARSATREARAEAGKLTRAIARDTADQRSVVGRLARTHNALEAAQDERRDAIASLEHEKEHALQEIGSLERESAQLAEAIRAAQRGETPSVEPTQRHTGRLSWPVSGPMVSGFGPRGGAMHEGIDIICSSGTPVRASGSGRVIYASWLGGYGNLVVVDHGGGLSTAYAHNTSFAARVGQNVSTGTVISYAGSTGRSSGPHVHFEVWVDGKAVDPMRYL